MSNDQKVHLWMNCVQMVLSNQAHLTISDAIKEARKIYRATLAIYEAKS